MKSSLMMCLGAPVRFANFPSGIRPVQQRHDPALLQKIWHQAFRESGDEADRHDHAPCYSIFTNHSIPDANRWERAGLQQQLEKTPRNDADDHSQEAVG